MQEKRLLWVWRLYNIQLVVVIITEITILLSVCFFLSIVADMTPPTSEAVPLIGTFFTCCMVRICVCFYVYLTAILGCCERFSRFHRRCTESTLPHTGHPRDVTNDSNVASKLVVNSLMAQTRFVQATLATNDEPTWSHIPIASHCRQTYAGNLFD
jgi:hypothetical protein